MKRRIKGKSAAPSVAARVDTLVSAKKAKKPILEHFLLAFEERREIIRAKSKSRLTFDCYKAKIAEGDRVKCSANHELSSQSLDKAITLAQVLKGIQMTVCQDCPDFDDGGESGD